MSWVIHQGDCREVLRTLPAESVQCCVTSPPYWGLRDYGVEGQLGLERTPEEYVAKMVEVFREVWRVLRPDGTLWLNLGDCYASAGGAGWQGKHGQRSNRTHTQRALKGRSSLSGSLKPKDLVGIPWMVAFALRAEGWWLRMDIIWHKPNTMPESIEDRPTKAHEYLFLLAKGERYFYDGDAIREVAVEAAAGNTERKFRGEHGGVAEDVGRGHQGFSVPWRDDGSGRNARSVWSVTTKPFTGAHFAVMPWDLAERCVRAGSRGGDSVLDPFAGAGTTGLVAGRHGRSFIGIELNPAYVALAEHRIIDDAPLLNAPAGRVA